jgi:ArsR family transcriptional regulator
MNAPDLSELNLLHATICKALGDPTRIQILYALDEEPRHVSALAESLDLPQPTVSRHLAILRQRGLVQPERDGLVVNYSLNQTDIIDVLDAMRQVLRQTLAQQSEALS